MIEFTASIDAPGIMGRSKTYNNVEELYNTLKVFIEEAKENDLINIRLFNIKNKIIDKNKRNLTNSEEEILKIIKLFPDSTSKLIIKELSHLSKFTIIHKLKDLTDNDFINRKKNLENKYVYQIKQ